MNTASTTQTTDRRVVLMFVVLALFMGVVTFAGIAFLLHGLMRQPAFANSNGITMIGLALMVASLVAQPLIMKWQDAAARKQIDPKSEETGPWIEALYTRTIIGSALLEAAAFMCLIGYLIEARWPGLAGGMVLAVVMLLGHLPTAGRVETYISRQRELAIQERS